VLTFRDGHLRGDEPVTAPLDAAAELATLPEEEVTA
jgi:hypothetical protein